MIPVALAWLGVLGSTLLPVAVFELTLAPWLIIKGVATPETA